MDLVILGSPSHSSPSTSPASSTQLCPLPFPVRDDDEYLDRTKVYSCGKEHGSIGHAQGRLAASLATNNYLCQPATQRWLKAVAEHGNQPEIVADRGMGGKKELWPFLLPISTWQIRPLKKHEKYVPPPLLDIAAFVPCESHKKQRQAEEGCVACLAGFCLPCQKRVADGGKSRGLCDMCPRDREDIVKQQTTAAKDQEEQKPNPLEFKVWHRCMGNIQSFVCLLNFWSFSQSPCGLTRCMTTTS